MHVFPHRAIRALAGLAMLGLVGSAASDTAERPADAQSTVVVRPAPVDSAHGFDHRMLKDIKAGVARVEPWLERYGYGAILVAVGVEGFGIPAPGQTILEAGSAASTSHVGRLRIGWVLLAAFVAAFIGTTLGYLIGRWGGRGLLGRLRIDPRHLARIEGQFDRYGGGLILFARFFDGPRQLIGISAGMMGMPWVRFSLFNLAGAALWVCFWGLGVYYLDLHLDQLVAVIRRINPWVATATLAALGVFGAAIWRLYRRRARLPR